MAELPQLQSYTVSSTQSSPDEQHTEALGMMADVMPRNWATVMPGRGGGLERRITEMPAFLPLRKVQQFLVDPDINIPLEKRILHEGPVFWTDENDHELSYRVPVQKLLEEHNILRAKTKDKAFRDKEIMLEPAKIRDLRLTTVTLAQV